MKGKKRLLALALAVQMGLSCLPVLSHQAQGTQSGDIYVSAGGKDSASGTESAPVATLQKAAELARAKSQNGKTPVTVVVRAGKYFLNETLTLGKEDSNVSWIGETGAVLTGAEPLSGLKWTAGENGVWSAATKKNLKVDELFVNGEQQILARYPNYDPTKTLQGSTSAADIKARSAGWKDPAGGYIRALHNHKWGGNSYKITGKSSNALGLDYTWVGDNNRGSGMHSSYVMVENIREELDAPKEWFYDRTAGMLYFKPAQGVTLDENTVVEAAVTPELIHIEGANNVSFTGFTLENTARTMYTGTYVPLMRSDWCVVRSGALFMQNAENITFKDGVIRNIGGNAVFMSGHNKNNRITNNEILNIGSSGVLLAGDPNSCREPSFWDNTPAPDADPYYVHKTTIEDQQAGPKAELYPVDCEISYNHIKNVGIWEKQSSQVALSVASRIKILHNTLNVGPRAGINVGDGTFGGHEIAYNDVFDVQLETDDHGMFNSWGRDRFWSLGGFDTGGNKGAQKEPFSRIDCYETIKIHDNRMHFGGRVDGGSTFGIDLDDGSSNYEIYNNLCLNMGIKLREGFHRSVYNNILVNGLFNLHCTFENSFDEIHSNLVVKGSGYALAATDQGRFAVSQDKIDKNWYWDLGGKITVPGFWNKLSYDAQGIFGTEDPMFRDPEKMDYTVTNAEAAKKVGFQNFPMDQFGKPGCADVCPGYVKTKPDSDVDVLEREQWMGATISMVTDSIMSSTGSGSLKGVYLEEVPADSMAAKFGLKTGDVLHTLNGMELVKKAQFVPAFTALADSAVVHMDIIRNQLPMELNFIKHQGQMQLVDDRDPRIQYGGGGWEYCGPDHNPQNGENCFYKTMTYKNVQNAGPDTNIVLSFQGDRVVLYGRKEKNMGDYNIVITDAAGKQELAQVASAYTDGARADKQVIFDSGKQLTMGSHTITVTRKSGDYIIVDAFGVYGPETGRDPSVVGPVRVENEKQNRITELHDGEALTVTVPVENHASAAKTFEASIMFWDGAGLKTLVSHESQKLQVAGGAQDAIKFNVTVPQNSGSMQMVLLVTDENGAALAYPYTLEGTHVEQGQHVKLTPETEGQIELSYTAESRLATAALKGCREASQVVMTVKNSQGQILSMQQATVKDGIVSLDFLLNLEKSDEITVTMTEENGTVKILKKTLDPNVSQVDKTVLEKALAEAEKILAEHPDGGAYTAQSWQAFKRAYYGAKDVFEDPSASQQTVQSAADGLNGALQGLETMTDGAEFAPSSSNRGQYFELYNAKGEKDGGDRDHNNGHWQVRASQVDATVPGAWFEMTQNFLSLEVYGANKGDSANFKVEFGHYDSDGNFVADTAEEITQSKDQKNVTLLIYKKDNMDGSRKTVRISQQDEEGRYLEIRNVKFRASTEKVPVADVALEESLTLEPGQQGKLHAVITPDNAYDPSVTWKSQDPAVASVSGDGTVTAHKAGTTQITVTTDDGQKTAVCTVTVRSQHEISQQWSHDETHHWHGCSCGQPHDKAAHSGGSAACTERAVCEICGEPYGAPAGHTLEHHEAFPATCTQSGTAAYWHCILCGKHFADAAGTQVLTDLSIPAAGHNLEHHEAVPATCTQSGTAEYWHCGLCGKDFGDEQGTQELTQLEVPAKGHTLTLVEAKAPTEKKPGNIRCYVCTSCGRCFADPEGRKELARDSVVLPPQKPGTDGPQTPDVRPDRPAQTGDSFQPILIGAVAVLALAGVVVLIVMKQKKRH